ncbi:Basement membrane proteoglycan [Halotydeus destructor]|nr:Basement membrane proteoglycan [Halotydeus destructor]
MYICDGIKDCQDGADESLPHCAKGPDGTVASHPQADGSQGSSSSASSSSSAEGSKDEKVTLTADDKGDKVQADVPVVEPAYYQCSPAEFMCRNGQCVDRRLQCDRRYDCMDRSDEENCGPSMSAFPDRPESQSMADVDLRVYDTPQTQMVGHDVVFRCRDEGLLRLGVSWSRRDGRPFPPRTSDINGRLTMYNITPSEAGTYVCRVSGRPIEKETYLSVIPRPNYPMGSDFGYPTGRDAGNYPPIEAGELRRALQVEVCGPGQIKCRNGECVPRDAVCNGKVDCKDKSDETSCHVRCKYDEFKCESNQCIRKTNRCDDRLNCLDGSDERNCQKNNGIYGDYGCHYNEFRCASGGQCVPDSYRCDGYFDCSDGSDEQRCQSPRFVKPPVETIQMVEGSTLNLNCTASGEPTPLIVWRYNMDYIGQASNSKITFCTTTCDYCGPNVVIGTYHRQRDVSGRRRSLHL